MVLDSDLKKRAEEWLRAPFDEQTQAEIRALIEAGNEKEVYDRFYTNLEFGTGGMRGVMAAGLNRMNRYIVARATQGLANYILKQASDKASPSVAIAFDSRINSTQFAKEAACVLAANGIKAYLFDYLRPTPELSFAVRHLQATAGIVITASHNPKEYNGYKVYWSDGGQIVPPHDKGIISEVNVISDFGAIKNMEYEEALKAGLIELIGSEIDEAYFQAILPLSLHPEICAAIGDSLRIIYTPLHGAGISLVPEALHRWGFKKVLLCESQKSPDGKFPTTASPNPEEKEALQEAIATAKSENADLVLATDPDCDRVGIAVRKNDEFVLMSGNQVASMLVDYVLSSHVDKGSIPHNAVVVKTIVTTELIAAICRHFNVHLDNVLTGFKYIGEKIRQYEENGKGQFLVGGEESYGYLVGTHSRDKDAAVCACFIAEMAAESMSRGETLLDRMEGLYQRYGIFEESLMSISLKGAEGVQKIQQIMQEFRQNPPTQFLGSPVIEIRDYQRDEIRDVRKNAVIGKTDLPKSNVLIFVTEKQAQIVARPSGTEPKIKFYFSICDTENLPIDSFETLKNRKEKLSQSHDRLRKEFSDMVHRMIGA